MAMVPKTVFISYRRTNVSWALAVYQYLTYRDYDVFFDYQNLPAGDFEQIIMENIRARAHFLIILTPSALERINEPGDWLRCEIEEAIAQKRNIVPLMLEGFDFGVPTTSKQLTGKLAVLNKYNGLRVPADYFMEAMGRLCERYLSVPPSGVMHPVSGSVAVETERQQRQAEEAATVTEKELGAVEWFEKGYKATDPVEKIACYSKAIELDPKYAYAYNNRGYAYNEIKQHRKAILDLERAIELYPKYAAAYNNRGKSYGALGQHKRAIEDYDKAIELDPKYAAAYNNRGNRYGNLGQHKRAIADYDKAIELDPELANAYYNKACCYGVQGMAAEAARWLREAFTRDATKFCKITREDSDFDQVRDSEEFKRLLEECCTG